MYSYTKRYNQKHKGVQSLRNRAIPYHEPDKICPLCNKLMIKPTVEHIQTLTKQGTNNVDNLTWVCHSCNSAKKDKGLLIYLIVRPRNNVERYLMKFA